MREPVREHVTLADLTEKQKLELALKLLEEPANRMVKDDVFTDVMEEAGKRDQQEWADHVLWFLAIGTYVTIEGYDSA